MVEAQKNHYFVAHTGESLLLEVEADCYKEAIRAAYSEWGWDEIDKNDVNVVFDNEVPLILLPITDRASSEIGQLSDIDDKIAALQKLNGVRYCIVSKGST